jgi:hypothetical protein
LAHFLAERGVDFIDVSSWGIHPMQSTSIKSGTGYHMPFALKIRESAGDKALASAVGGISTGTMGKDYIWV